MKFIVSVVALFALSSSVWAQTAVNSVQAQHAEVSLVSEYSTVVPGQTFSIALNYKLEPHWHVYWENPGASGLALDLEWTLPDGFHAGKIEWPAPERILLGGLTNYGYENEVTFLVPITVDSDVEAGNSVELSVDAFWLICKEVCLPGEGSFRLQLEVGEDAIANPQAELFAAARKSMPLDSIPWELSAFTEDESLILRLVGEQMPADFYFYASKEGVVDPNADQLLSFVGEDTAELRMTLAEVFRSNSSEQITGVLQSGETSWRVQVDLDNEAVTTADFAAESATPPQQDQGFEAFLLELGLPGWLMLAFLGGLILNVMPCVLPVLSLKVFSLLKQTGEAKSQALLHGVVYTVGVVVSFLVLAGILFALRAVGERVGWGFQLQSPGFIVVLTLVFFLFALNLMGVFELGASLVGADARVAKRRGLGGSFGMGVLAAVVGAPCVGPLLASVGGIAVQAPVSTGLLIFGTMGLGLASPFLILALFPKLMAYLPKPGAWMETVKQLMGFLLLAAVLFLAYVAGASGGVDAMLVLLVTLLLSGFAAWVYGRWAAPVRAKRCRTLATFFTVILLIATTAWGISRL